MADPAVVSRMHNSTSELIDMLLSAITDPQHAALAEPCERELRGRQVLTGPPTPWLLRLLYRQYP